jgi:hypothetical protein
MQSNKRTSPHRMDTRWTRFSPFLGTSKELTQNGKCRAYAEEGNILSYAPGYDIGCKRRAGEGRRSSET